MNGLRTTDEYLKVLAKLYPHVPYQVVKKVETKYKNESDMKNELSRLNQLSASNRDNIQETHNR